VTVAGDVTLPDDTLDADPLPGALADNGGPTATMALDPESPAIDAGKDNADLAFDQRVEGFARISGAGPDIGASSRRPGLPTGSSRTVSTDAAPRAGNRKAQLRPYFSPSRLFNALVSTFDSPLRLICASSESAAAASSSRSFT
jgi:hypothetical protein